MRKLLLVFFSLFYQALLAQEFGSIEGTITENEQVVEFANVFITPLNDSTKIVAGTVSNETGRFQMEKIPVGAYLLHIQLLGFRHQQLPVELMTGSQWLNVGTIRLESDTQLLNVVEVHAAKELIQKTDEGFVVNAAANLTQIGGTASDLLKNMPGVLVSADGEVMLRGKTPLVMINGRISGVGVSRMQQIPASSIERIEIINNPSAKYDADSEGGIINIVLKKNENPGTNGAFALGAGKGDRYRLNLSALLNHQAGDWNIGGAYDNWYTTRTRNVQGDRINYDVPDQYYLTQRRYDERLVFYQNAKATVDYAPGKRDLLNLELLWAFPGEDNHETLKNTTQTAEGVFTGSNQRYSNEIRRSNTMEASMKYSHTFRNPEKKLIANVSNTFGNDKEDTDITTTTLSETGVLLDTSSVQRTHVYPSSNLFNLSMDYSLPVGGNGLLETGYKGILRYLYSDYERATLVDDTYVIDTLNTNIFEFREHIHAGYIQYTGRQGDKDSPRWKYNAGIRLEQSWNNGETIDLSTDFNNQYFNWFPSGSLSYYTTSRNNIRLSYSKRIARPGVGQLNPFTDITDSLNQRSGNPYLKPELIHSFELTYNQNLKKGSISWVAFYRLRNDAILPYTVLDENGVAFTQPQNFGKATTLGAEIIASCNPVSFYGFNASVSAFNISIEDVESSSGIANSTFTWYMKLINNFKVVRNGSAQLTWSYTAPTAIPQGESVAVYFVDAGYQHSILNGKGRLGLVITDIFNTQKNGVTIDDADFTFSRIFKQDTRAVMATFGYTFGTTFRDRLMENRFKND